MTSTTRYEGDTWDLASSVGMTATMVAAARAMATREERPLINDPFAEPLVRAVGVDLLTRLASGELDPAELNDVVEAQDGSAGSAGAMSRMADNMAVRTKFFDEFFLDATKAGIKQVVILASGLDSSPSWAPSPLPTGAWSPSTCATTGPPRCGPRDSTRVSRPRGALRDCSVISHRKLRTACSTPSPSSARRAASWPPKARAISSPATWKS